MFWSFGHFGWPLGSSLISRGHPRILTSAFAQEIAFSDGLRTRKLAVTLSTWDLPLPQTNSRKLPQLADPVNETESSISGSVRELPWNRLRECIQLLYHFQLQCCSQSDWKSVCQHSSATGCNNKDRFLRQGCLAFLKMSLKGVVPVLRRQLSPRISVGCAAEQSPPPTSPQSSGGRKKGTPLVIDFRAKPTELPKKGKAKGSSRKGNAQSAVYLTPCQNPGLLSHT